MRELPLRDKKKTLVRVSFWTFVLDYVLVVLGVHYIGISHRAYDTLMTATYEPLSWKGAVEFALPVAFATCILVSVKWSRND